MEETNNDQQMNGDGSKGPGKNWMLIAAMILLVLAGGYYFMTQGSKTATENPSETANTQPTTNGDETVDEIVADDETGVASDEEATTEVQLVDVEGGMFYFKPNKIVVKKDVPVKITFKNVEGMHDFVVDELDVRSDKILAGKTTVVEFTPTKVGEFEFYCSVMDHKAKGMVGTLVVE